MKSYCDPTLYMENFLPKDFYTRIAAGKGNRRHFPEFRDRTAWEKLRSNPYCARFIPVIGGTEQRYGSQYTEVLRGPLPRIILKTGSDAYKLIFRE